MKTISKQKIILFIILIASLATSLISVFREKIYSWDGSVYAGMGKYIFSGGQIGLWEPFRPPLLPILEGLVWKIGISPIHFGSLLAILASLGVIFLTYHLGEKISKNAGVLSAIVIAFTPLFVKYAYLPMTDILSTFLVLVAIYFLLKAKNFGAGVFAGLAFLSRFSQGLIVPILAIVFIFMWWQKIRGRNWKLWWREFVLDGVKIAGGFLVVVLPFFVWSERVYGDFLFAVKAGAGVIKHSLFIYDKGAYFYFTALFANNFILVLSLLGLILIGFSFWRMKRSRAEVGEKKAFNNNIYAFTVAIAGIIYFLYFTWQVHKEIRYALPFLPFIAILSGYALSDLLNRLKLNQIIIAVVALLILIPFTVGKTISTELFAGKVSQDFIHFLDGKKGDAISATPMPVATSDIRIIDAMYDNWQSAYGTYKKDKGKIDYVILDSCVFESACSVDSTCKNGKDDLINELGKDGEKIFAGNEGSCEFSIYKLDRYE